PQDLDEVAALQLPQPLEGLGEPRAGHLVDVLTALLALPPRQLSGDEHLADELLPVRPEEHVLRPAQADAIRPELPSPRGALTGVGVGAHAELPELVGPGQDLAECLA